ncbi:MAG TPA: SAM-dependent methyltransferase [Acidimicrobiales bacterium]
MTGPSKPQDPELGRPRDPFAIEFDVPHPARLQNYLAGGDANFAVDRELAEKMSEALPGGIDTAKAVVKSVGSFVGRCLRYLTGEPGIRQFLHIGVSVPTTRSVHETAQQAAPDARIVYVSNDPIVLARAHDLMAGAPEGTTGYVHGSLHDPQAILEQAAETLDLRRPVAVVLPTTLVFYPDDHDPYGLLSKLLEEVVPGSYLAVAHSSHDFRAQGMAEASSLLSQALRDLWTPRDKAAIQRFFDGLVMVEPGLVQIDRCQPGEPESPTSLNPSAPPDRPTPIYAGLARKP